nr:hypothetical protein [Tanacetum cinerariifolium]
MIDELDRDEGATLMGEKEEEKAEKVKDFAGDAQVEGRQAEIQAEIYQINMDHAANVLSMQEDEPKVKEVVEVVTTAKLITEAITAASTPSKLLLLLPDEEEEWLSGILEKESSAKNPAETKSKDKGKDSHIPTKVVDGVVQPISHSTTRKRKGVVIRDLEEKSTAIIPAETKSKNKGKGIMVEEPKPIKRKDQVELDEEYARKLHEELNKDIDLDIDIEHMKQKAKEDSFVMSYDDIRPIFEAKFNTNIEFLLKSKEQTEEEENITIKSINETPAQKAAKRRKLNEKVKEVKDLKQHLEIVPDEDNDVYTEATPLARNILVVDYQIIQLNNKPCYKIIRADGTHQLYISFITLLKNFDREDLESLWSIVKERFFTSKPNNFSDDYLLTNLRRIFEILDGQ